MATANKTTTEAPKAQAAAPAQPAAADPNAGRGGLYKLVDGQRVLVARTHESAEAKAAAEAKAKA